MKMNKIFKATGFTTGKSHLGMTGFMLSVLLSACGSGSSSDDTTSTTSTGSSPTMTTSTASSSTGSLASSNASTTGSTTSTPTTVPTTTSTGSTTTAGNSSTSNSASSVNTTTGTTAGSNTSTANPTSTTSSSTTTTTTSTASSNTGATATETDASTSGNSSTTNSGSTPSNTDTTTATPSGTSTSTTSTTPTDSGLNTASSGSSTTTTTSDTSSTTTTANSGTTNSTTSGSTNSTDNTSTTSTTTVNDGQRYVKVDNQGNELPASASSWRCVKDKTSGLLWEEKTNDEGLQDKDWRYRHFHNYAGYASNIDFNGKILCKNIGGSSCDAYSYVTALNAQGLCGRTNWRLPVMEELLNLAQLNPGGVRPSIDLNYFPETTNNSGYGAYCAENMKVDAYGNRVEENYQGVDYSMPIYGDNLRGSLMTALRFSGEVQDGLTVYPSANWICYTRLVSSH